MSNALNIRKEIHELIKGYNHVILDNFGSLYDLMRHQRYIESNEFTITTIRRYLISSEAKIIMTNEVKNLQQLYGNLFAELAKACTSYQLASKMDDELVDKAIYISLINDIQRCQNAIRNYVITGDYDSILIFAPSIDINQLNSMEQNIIVRSDPTTMMNTRVQFIHYKDQYYHMIKAVSTCREIVISIEKINLLLDTPNLWEGTPLRQQSEEE